MVLDSSVVIIVGVVQNRPGKGCWYLFRLLPYRALRVWAITIQSLGFRGLGVQGVIYA